jgi:hypothetical protein
MQNEERKHPTAKAWCLYRPKDGNGDRLRIYNTTNSDVPLVIQVKGRDWMLDIMEWEYAPDYVPRSGDMIFRRLTNDEREHLARLSAKARWQRTRAKGIKGHRRDMLKILEKKLVVFTLSDAAN